MRRGYRECRCCKRVLSPKFWTTKTALEMGKCDSCMRVDWLARNDRARGKAPVQRSVTVPKGWGF